MAAGWSRSPSCSAICWARNRATSDVFDYTTFRPEKSSNNATHYFQPQPQSIAPTRIAFIGTGGTASASELVINGLIPYLHANAALIGTNTYGKPVGQIALDRSVRRPAARDRLRDPERRPARAPIIDGLATFVEASCQAGDDVDLPARRPARSLDPRGARFPRRPALQPGTSGGLTAQSVGAMGSASC